MNFLKRQENCSEMISGKMNKILQKIEEVNFQLRTPVKRKKVKDMTYLRKQNLISNKMMMKALIISQRWR